MQLDPWRLANSFWILLGMYWVLKGIRVKPQARRERGVASVLHIVAMVIACVLLFAANAGIGPLGLRFVPAGSWTAWLGAGVTAAGCGFAAWGRAFLGPNWSAMVSVRKGHELVRSGPYAIVRHPIYTGLLVAVLGSALVVGQVRALVALAIACIAWFRKARREERLMIEQFDGEYVEYSRSVKRLIPFIL